MPVGPENSFQDERVRDIIIERNWFRAGSSTEVLLKLFASRITVRNNLFDQSNGANGLNDNIRVIWVDRRGIEPIPDANRIYNNTIYRSNGIAGGTFYGIVLSLGTNMVVRNNLGYAPSISGAVMLVDGATATTKSNNSSDSQLRGMDPRFTVTPPTTPAQYKPMSGYAVGGGSISPKAPVWSDFFRAPTPSTPDIGAVIH